MFKKEIITTADDYKRLVYFTQFSLKKYPTVVITAASILIIASIIIGIIGIIPILIAAAICAVLFGIIAFFPLFAAKKAKDGIKYGKVAINAKRTFEYDTAGIKIYGGRTETNINAAWNTLFAIYELDDCFIIYITYEAAFIISKSQLTLPEAIQMRNYFEKRMQNRFFLRCKR